MAAAQISSTQAWLEHAGRVQSSESRHFSTLENLLLLDHRCGFRNGRARWRAPSPALSAPWSLVVFQSVPLVFLVPASWPYPTRIAKADLLTILFDWICTAPPKAWSSEFVPWWPA